MSPAILLVYVFLLFYVFYCFVFLFFLLFTFHGSIYVTCLLVYCFIVLLCLVYVPLYLFTFTTFFQGVCSSFYRNMHLVKVKCMFLELCAHCIHAKHVHC